MGVETEAGWIRCRYFGFWDVPRALLLSHEGRLFLLDSPFEEERDDYRPAYHVWELADVPLELAESLSWAELEARRVRQRPDLPVAALKFDTNRERQDGRFYARLRFTRPGEPFP